MSVNSIRARESLVRETASIRRSAPILEEIPRNRPLGEVISDRRLELGYRQLDIGQAIGVTDTMVGKIENGVRVPDIKFLPAMAHILRIDLAAFSEAYLRGRAPQVYKALLKGSPSQQRLNSLPADLRRTVIELIDRLYNEERQRKSA